MHRGLSALASSGHVLERAPGAAAPSPTPARGPTSPLPVPHISQGGRAGSLAPPSVAPPQWQWHQQQAQQQQQAQAHAQAQAQAAAQLRAQLQAQQGELRRVQKALEGSEAEVMRLNAAAEKLSIARDAELDRLKAAMSKEKEDRLAKMQAAHARRLAARDDELTSLKAAKERELAKAAASHQKALRAKEEEVGAARREAARREEERTRKLSEAHKELQQDLGKRDEQLAALRRSLATAEASASEARKGKAAAEAAHEAELAERAALIARSAGHAAAECGEGARGLGGAAAAEAAAEAGGGGGEGRRGAEERGVAEAIAATLARERAVLREAVLGAREMAERMAEGRLEYSREEGALLEEKARQHIEDVTAPELHWLVTAPHRAWLNQSYAECDEVAALAESEQRQLKRSSQATQLELGKIRSQLDASRSNLSRAYHALAVALFLALATATYGAWRAASNGDMTATLQEMGVAWLAILAALPLLLADAGPTHPTLPPPRRCEAPKEALVPRLGGRVAPSPKEAPTICHRALSGDGG